MQIPDNIPQNPGCYLFKDKGENIIYVGKAKVLKNRVSSYFHGQHDEKTAMMLQRADSIAFIVTRNEVEALILENTLIKQHQPMFNIDLKDSKRYAYILVTDESYPRLLTAREKSRKGELFGPFVSGFDRLQVIAALNRIFRLCTCKQPRKRPCLRFHMGHCDGACAGLVTQDEYRKRISRARAILKGNSEEIIKQMREEMKAAAKDRQFERGLALRSQIEALSGLAQRQVAELDRRFDEDIIDTMPYGGKIHLVLFHVDKGTLRDKQEFAFDPSDSYLEEFIVQFYSENPVPRELIVRDPLDPSIGEFLAKKRGGPVRVLNPKAGQKRWLLDMARMNLEAALKSGEDRVRELGEKLEMAKMPDIIECFDISHISGTNTVASMVQFRGGKPSKANYRRFRIRTVEGVDDPRSIFEVVSRRYRRLLAESQPMPDLAIIDGGQTQLNAAMNALKSVGAEVPIIAIAKRMEEIYIPGKEEPLQLPPKSKAILLVRQIRDEAHRFAITYHRLLRKKALKEANSR